MKLIFFPFYNIKCKYILKKCKSLVSIFTSNHVYKKKNKVSIFFCWLSAQTKWQVTHRKLVRLVVRFCIERACSITVSLLWFTSPRRSTGPPPSTIPKTSITATLLVYKEKEIERKREALAWAIWQRYRKCSIMYTCIYVYVTHYIAGLLRSVTGRFFPVARFIPRANDRAAKKPSPPFCVLHVAKKKYIDAADGWCFFSFYRKVIVLVIF